MATATAKSTSKSLKHDEINTGTSELPTPKKSKAPKAAPAETVEGSTPGGKQAKESAPVPEAPKVVLPFTISELTDRTCVVNNDKGNIKFRIDLVRPTSVSIRKSNPLWILTYSPDGKRMAYEVTDAKTATLRDVLRARLTAKELADTKGITFTDVLAQYNIPNHTRTTGELDKRSNAE